MHLRSPHSSFNEAEWVFGFLHGGRVREGMDFNNVCSERLEGSRFSVSFGHGCGREGFPIRRSAALLMNEMCLYLIDYRDRRNRFDGTGFLLVPQRDLVSPSCKGLGTSPRPRRIETIIANNRGTL